MSGEEIVIESDDRSGIHYVNVSAVFAVDVSHLPVADQMDAAESLVHQAMLRCKEEFKVEAPKLKPRYRVH